MTGAIPRTLVADALGLDGGTEALPPGDLPLARFAERYVGFLRDTRDTEAPGGHPEFWTYCVFDELARSAPELCLDAVLASLDLCTDPEDVALIAAGPLEDVIAQHGAGIVGRIEDAARGSPRLRYALSGVWPRGNETGAVWQRIEAARAGAGEIDAGDPLPPPA